jgi:DNA-binding transcriptional ArsR family regulator
MPRQSKKADDLGELLKILSHPHRRRIITRLHERNPRDEDEFELEELAGSDEFDTETLMLIHSHLPKLAEAGFINWDREQEIVTRGPRFEEIAPLVDLMVAHQDELPANWL